MLDLCRKNLYNVYNCADQICEVIEINKRKFLTELGKLLTFMYEEDRLRALAMYERMFDGADETAVLQYLGSPTKQAVMVARAYNAKERKLAVTSQIGENDADVSQDEDPEFFRVIQDIREEAIQRGIMPDISDEQSSVFDDETDEADTAEALFEEDSSIEADNLTEEITPDETPLPESDPVPVAEKDEHASAEPVFEDLTDFEIDLPDEVTAFMAESEIYSEPVQQAENTERSEEPAAAGSEEAASDADESAAVTEAGEEPQEPYNYMLDLGPIPEEPRVDATEIDEYMAAFREKDENKEPVQPSPEQTTLFEPETQAVEKALPWKDDSEEENRSSGRLVVPIMILYLLVAVPLTTIAVLVLLVPTLIFLGLAAASGIAAFRIAMLAFNSFAVFADIIVVLGAALLLTALTIFFFWIFIWFIGGGIAGAINLAIQIGSKVCYKEGKKA